jgi:hypothetical protein
VADSYTIYCTMRNNFLAIVLLLSLHLFSLPVRAEDTDVLSLDTSTDTVEVSDDKWNISHLLESAWGEPAFSKLYLGMWSEHIVDDDDEYISNHQMLGVVLKGYFVGTFLTSHDNRGWAAGVQRDVYRDNWRGFTWEVGYRAGLVYGYEQLSISETKLFPLLLLYGDVGYEKIGLQFSWTASVVTAGFYLKF